MQKLSFCCLAMLCVLGVNTAFGEEYTVQSTETADQAATTLAIVKSPQSDRYTIGSGDVLTLSVWKDTALSREVTVLPDGMISLPLVGQILAAGKTISELEREVTEQIKRFLPDPVLDINVLQANSMLVHVVGEVRGPGVFPIQTKINVLQVLAMAGGLDNFADRDEIKVYREEEGKIRIFTFNYDEVMDGERLEQNIRLVRGDIVVVP